MVTVDRSEDACEPGKQDPRTGVVQVVTGGLQPSATEQGQGITRGQLKVAVAVWMVPSADDASAMIVVSPFP
jgi:hypothetical protein